MNGTKYLKECMKDAGAKGQIHTSLKKMKLSNELCMQGIMRYAEDMSRDKHQAKYEDESGKHIRKRIYKRVSKYKVIIADSDEDKVDQLLEKFLIEVGYGYEDNDNYVAVEIGEVEWLEEGDHILKPKIAVQFTISLVGGIYKDFDTGSVKYRSTAVERKGIYVGDDDN